MRLSRLLPSSFKGAPSGAGVDVVIDGEAISFASRPARALLGDAARIGAPASGLGVALGHELAPRAIHDLIQRGRPFRLRLRLGEDRVYDLEGAPLGARSSLSLRDITDDAQALETTRAELAAAQREVDALRGALSLTGAQVWKRAADGSVDWRSDGAIAADEGRGVMPRDFQTLRLEGETSLSVAVGHGGGQAGQTALRDFIETVTETFAHLRAGLAIFDADRRLTLSNPALAELFSVELRWLAGRPSLRDLLDRLREARQLPEQADYPAWRARLFTLFDQPSRATYEDVWELPDGRALSVIGRPHPQGGIAFVFEDATESMALQRWRSTAVEVRRATLDALSDAVAVFGPDGQVRMTNPAFRAMWDLSEEELDAPSHVSMVAERCATLGPEPNMWERIRQAVAGGAGRSAWRAHARLRDGRVIGARVAPMPDGSTLSAFFDVTAEEQVAQALRDRAAALEAADELRLSLLEQVAHRLKTPLNSILGFAEMLAQGRAGTLSEAQAGYVGAILEGAEQLRDGMSALTALGGTHALEPTEATSLLGVAVKASFDLLARSMAEKRIELAIQAPSDHLRVLGDPARIRQQIYDFASEAVQACETGAVLTVGAEVEQAKVILWRETDAGARATLHLSRAAPQTP